jgi:hypothetical protein
MERTPSEKPRSRSRLSSMWGKHGDSPPQVEKIYSEKGYMRTRTSSMGSRPAESPPMEKSRSEPPKLKSILKRGGRPNISNHHSDVEEQPRSRPVRPTIQTTQTTPLQRTDSYWDGGQAPPPQRSQVATIANVRAMRESSFSKRSCWALPYPASSQ